MKKVRVKTALLVEAFRHLSVSSRGRTDAVRSLIAATRGDHGSEFTRVGHLLWLHRRQISNLLGQLNRGGRFRYQSITTDAASAHRKVAAIQEVLALLGYHLGSALDTAKGLYGGPSGKPVKLELKKVTRLIGQTPRTKKLISKSQFGQTESWTRDAVRRLQAFLGGQNLGSALAPKGSCLVRPDGLFGQRTLKGLRTVIRSIDAK